MEWAPFVLGMAGGVLGGVVAVGLRLLHLETEWHMVRMDLRRFYQRSRQDRPLEITPKAPPREMTAQEIRAHVLARNPHLRGNGE